MSDLTLLKSLRDYLRTSLDGTSCLVQARYENAGINSVYETVTISVRIGSSKLYQKLAEIKASTFSQEPIVKFFPGFSHGEYEKLLLTLAKFKP